MAVLCKFSTLVAGIFAVNLVCVATSSALQGERVKKNDSVANSIVLILVENRHTCTGVVIGTNKILTAAHCVVHYGKKKFKPENVKVYYTRNLYADPHFVGKVSKITIHPGYVVRKKNKNGYEPATAGSADVAILWMAEPHPSRAKDAVVLDSDDDITSALQKVDVPSVIAYGFGPENQKFCEKGQWLLISLLTFLVQSELSV
jgi:hypothetical protein